jgi:hypothetical protein
MCTANFQNEEYRRLFSIPRNVKTNEALSKWPRRNGDPDRGSRYAGLCEAVNYQLWRIFGEGSPLRDHRPMEIV